MGASISDITSGMALRVDDGNYIVVDYSHVKPGKGAAFVRVRLRHMKTDLILERTFRNSDKIEVLFLEDRTYQYQYKAGDSYHFMDQETYEEMVVSAEELGDKAVKYLQDNIIVTATFCEHKLQRITLPNFIVAQIIETDPGFKGDSSKAGNKPAKIDTGATVPVPLFINTGDFVKIDTRSDEYIERVQK
ncbi:MAG TPA: elongation factor P [Candidatus Omnitrophota bacterium]|nr:elongation factor P [Candidatus Omnitrophota bacterium]HPD83917.1 elongation factor P [Candidatus Omnitrophota bacterium]HRZ02774.1 elongation factor P [Candidatus Omnitrophota bacterium]